MHQSIIQTIALSKPSYQFHMKYTHRGHNTRKQ